MKAQVCLIFGWFALKHKLTEVLRGSLSHCLLTKSIVRPSTAPGNLRLVERVGFSGIFAWELKCHLHFTLNSTKRKSILGC